MCKENKSILLKLLSVITLITVLFTFQAIPLFAATKIPPVAIEYFYPANDTSNASYNIPSGTTVVLKYKVLNAASVEIIGLEKDPECLPPIEGAIEAWPMATTTYTLYAYDSAGNIKATRSFTVNVDTASIEKFTATPDVLESPGNVILNWEGFYASKVTISGPNYSKAFDYTFNPDTFEGYSFSGSVTINPKATAVYTLSASGLDGKTITKNITVNICKPTVTKLEASSTEIEPGQNVTITWNTEYSKKVALSDGTAIVSQLLNGSSTVSPVVDTTYTLTVYDNNNNAQASKSITIKVKKPVIVSFTSNNYAVADGKTVTLSWDVKYAKYINITGKEKVPEETLPLKGSIEVWPAETTTYTLEAYGYDNKLLASKSLTVTVKNKQVEVMKFTADKYSIVKGALVKLSWTTKNAVSCRIETSSGPKLKKLPEKGTIFVTPNKTITYTLIATDALGNTSQKSLTVEVNKKNK